MVNALQPIGDSGKHLGTPMQACHVDDVDRFADLYINPYPPRLPKPLFYSFLVISVCLEGFGGGPGSGTARPFREARVGSPRGSERCLISQDLGLVDRDSRGAQGG